MIIRVFKLFVSVSIVLFLLAFLSPELIRMTMDCNPMPNRMSSEIAMLTASIESYRQDTGVYPPDYISSDLDEDGDGNPHNPEESAKALYDFLCLPMKGRTDQNGNPLVGIQPYYKPDISTLKPCGSGNGWGAKKPTDCFMIIDIWGRPIHYRSHQPIVNADSFDLWSAGADGKTDDFKASSKD